MEKIISQLKAGRVPIAILGDSILDAYFYGKLREKDGVIFQTCQREYAPGGAGNVAYNIQRLGCDPLLFSLIGKERESQLFCDLLKRHGISLKGLVRSGKKELCVKTRLLHGKTRILRLDQDDITAIPRHTEDHLAELIRQSVNGMNVLIISDYRKGCLTQGLYKMVMEICKEQSIKILLDSARAWDLNGVYLFKPNLGEFLQLIGKENLPETELLHTAITFRRKTGVENLLITMGQQGVLYVDKEDQVLRIPSMIRCAKDPCGAGDTMLASIACCISKGVGLREAVHFANVAAGAICMKQGTQTVSLSEVRSAFHEWGSKANDTAQENGVRNQPPGSGTKNCSGLRLL